MKSRRDQRRTAGRRSVPGIGGARAEMWFSTNGTRAPWQKAKPGSQDNQVLLKAGSQDVARTAVGPDEHQRTGPGEAGHGWIMPGIHSLRSWLTRGGGGKQAKEGLAQAGKGSQVMAGLCVGACGRSSEEVQGLPHMLGTITWVLLGSNPDL